MVEERIVVESPRSSGGAGWVIAVVLILALVLGVFFFSQSSGSEAVKDNAIANAASDVGSAAKQVGNAAESAADNTKK
jgi:uncharacterized protein (UPF0333 family)